MAVVERPPSTSFSCGHCGAELAFAGVRSERCPYCASPNVAVGEQREHVEPTLIVPFVVDAGGARDALARWLGARRVFADPAFGGAARVDGLRGVYVPAYLYSAVAKTEYSAHIGENYTEVETHTAKDERGRDITKTRTITRTEYRVLSGRHVGYVADVVVSASAGMAHDELAASAFDLSQLRRFQPALISGWIAEHFSRDAAACMRASRAEAGDRIGDELRRFMPGDSYSDLAYRTTVSWESLEPVLVPVWVLALRYRDDKPALRVTINGQTGEVAGRVPIAWWKVALAIAMLATIAAVVAWWLA